MSEDLLADIEKDTVDLQLNFDDTLNEPVVLPTRVPNLLINGVGYCMVWLQICLLTT